MSNPLNAEMIEAAGGVTGRNFTVASNNLFDKDSPDLVTGYYVNSNNGALTANAGYNALQYIPIEPSTDYTFSRSGQIAWFTAAKAYISGDVTTADNTPKTLTSPAGAAYVGVSVKPAWTADFRINAGDAVLDYQPAGLLFDYDAIEDDVQEQINASAATAADAGPFYGLRYLKRARINLRKRLRNTSAQVRIAWHMDSWGSAFNVHYALIYHLLRTYDGGGATAIGLGGPGWIGAAYVSSAVKSSVMTAAGAYTVARTGTWSDNFGTDIYSPDACSASGSDTAATYTFASTSGSNPVVSAFKLLVGGTGSFDYSWDNDNWTTVSLTDGNRQEVTLSGGPGTGNWTLYIRRPDASSFKIMGLLPETTASGAVGHAINATGITTQARAAANPTAFAANAALINPDIVFLGTPINDRNAARSASQWAADLSTLIDLWRTWNPSVDICVIMPMEVGGSNTTTPAMSAYTAAAKELIDTKRIALIDFQPLCGASVADYGYSSTANSLLDSANTHLSGATNDGIMLYQDALLRVVLGA